MATKPKLGIPVNAGPLVFLDDNPDDYIGDRYIQPAAPQAPAPEDTSTFRRVVGDGAITALKGAIGVPEAAVGLADIVTGGNVGKALENQDGAIGFRPKQAKEYLDQFYSPAQQAANRAVQTAANPEDSLPQRILDTGVAAVRNPSTIVHAVGESLPSMGAGGVLARGVMAMAPRMSAFAAAGVGEGVVGAGSSASQIRQETPDGLLTPGQSAIAAGSGALTAGLGIVAGKVAKSLGIGDIDTMIAGGGGATPAMQKGFVRKLLEGAFTEGVLEELPQSVQEQVAQNYALGKPLDEGVDQAAVMGLLSGGAMGAGAANIGRPAVPNVGPLSRGANTAAATMPPVAPTAPTAGEAPSAPIAPVAPLAPEQEQQMLQQANARLSELDQKAKGTKEKKEGDKIVTPETPAQLLTPQETKEREFLQQAGGDVQALQRMFGAPEAPAPVEATPASDPAAAAQRAADKPALPTETAREGDILNSQGKPFTTMPGAMRAQRQAGDGFEIVPVRNGDRAGLVVRAKQPAATAPGAATTAAVSEAPKGAATEAPQDDLYDQALQVVRASGRGSISEVQRHLKIGYNRAARLLEEMERRGIVSPMTADGRRTLVQQAPKADAKPSPAATEPVTAAASIAGPKINAEWAAFAPESGTRNVSRADMPQIRSIHRGAMTNFLNARGIEHEQDEVPASSLKPTQAEFSPEKVAKARGYAGDTDRSILVSADGHVLDGHHQWMAKLEDNQPVKVIRLKAPIDQLLKEVAEFPSAQQADGATDAAPTPESKEPAPAPDMGNPMSEKAPAASAAAPADATVRIPPEVDAALTEDMTRQQARMKRLRTAAESPDLSLDDKLAAQTKAKAAEATLAKMRRTRFDAEDAIAAGQDFAPHADIFPRAAAVLQASAAPAPAPSGNSSTPAPADVQPGDILNTANGKPFKNMAGAMDAQRAAGDDYEIKRVRAGLVVRRKEGAPAAADPKTASSDEPSAPAEKSYPSISDAEAARKAAGQDTHVIEHTRRGLVVRPKPAETAAEPAFPNAITRAKKAKQSVPRAMTYEGRAVDGGPLNPGDIFTTASGRTTTAYPSQKGQKFHTQWLIDNAVAEAQARGDDFNTRMFSAEKPGRGGFLPPASGDSMKEYLFGQQPAVPRPFLKPLNTEPKAKPQASANTIFTEEAAAAALEVLRRKLRNVNSGIDPELLQAGITRAGYHIERGARTFAAYSQAMLAELGDAIRPYLKSFYMAVKYDPRAAAFEGMDSAATVEAAGDTPTAATSSRQAGKDAWNGMSVASRKDQLRIAGYTDSDQQRHFANSEWSELPERMRFKLDEQARNQRTEPVPDVNEDSSVQPTQKTAPEIIEHVTGKGKTLRGVVRTDLTLEQAQAIDQGTFRKNGGFFIRESRMANEQRPAQPDATHTGPAGTLTDFLAAKIAAGEMPKDNPALRKLVEAHDQQEPSQARMKEAQEALEAAIVGRARDIMATTDGDRRTFDKLVDLYQSQPLLNIRTSTSIANQAYSTPAPLAFVASELAGINPGTTVLEPTAGTGMLLIGTLPDKAIANELNPDRVALLRAQGFAKVTERDATERVTPLMVDRVITNPPFGPIKDAGGESIKVKVDGYTLGQVDHLIAARALEAMKDDGRAVLIIGANKVTGQQSNNDLIFFNWLYGNYRVTSHFEVDGDLYERQGAGWPVRVIAIQGRFRSNATAPDPATITRATNWSEVYEQFNQGLVANGPGAQPAAGTVSAGPVTPNDPKPVPAAADSQAGQADPGRPAGRAPRAGDVAGERAGPVDDSGVPAGERVGGSNREQRPDGADPVGRGLGGVDGGGRAAKPAGDTGSAGLTAADNQFQTTYTARSSRKDDGVLIPVNMAGPTQDALNRLEDAVGDLDTFVQRELGYPSKKALHDAFMGLQVDSVAAAIFQIKAGKGVIIADQTGIGKGRQAAAVIRWAVRNGKVPVFVTVKPSLFTDMYGDLHDIGTDDVAPLILNVDEHIKGGDDAKLFANRKGLHTRTLRGVAGSGKLPEGRNALFMTYSQINVDNVQRAVVQALAPNAVFVLDESHNAGGESNTGEFVRGVLDIAAGVTYLSATYAKRPDNMPVYFKTDMGDAVADDETLMSAMAAGGLPLQTVVANNLVKAGQMFRRERSYDGVSIESRADTAHRAEHRRLSDATTVALRAIVDADRAFHEGYVKQLQKELKKEGSRVLDMAGNQATRSVDHTQFTSIVHNFVRQMLLGLKAQEAADDAIRSLKRGEKPLIAVENTMGSFLSEYASSKNLSVGDSLSDFGYRNVLSRALERTRFIVHQLPNGDKEKEFIPLSALDPMTLQAYEQAQEIIDGIDINIPVSPIDWMRQEITKAGYTVAEITGRDMTVDYSNPKAPKLGQLDAREKKDKVRTTRLFNSGKLDALILNVAGSTGISLHASEKFTDQRQRHMIVAQAAQDINIVMQMLGRIHRTGQVALPKYTLLSADLPAEIRPTALLSAKMKSLNANTSSNTESATSVKAVDMLNKYGDRIVGQYLADNFELAQKLGVDATAEGKEAAADTARTATGRLALMPVAVQEQFYAEVEEQYNALIDYLNKTNQNELEPSTFDFEAEERKTDVLFEGQNPESPFGEDAIYGEYSVKAQGKPMTPAEIRATMAENLGGKDAKQHTYDLSRRLEDAFTNFVAGLKDAQADTARATRAKGLTFLRDHPIGAMFRVDINGDVYNAAVTNIRNTHKATGNPFSLSKFQVTVALNGALRSVTVPGTQFDSITTSAITGYGSSIEREFREGPPNERETAKIITGNLLGAYGELDGTRGAIIAFTKADGTTEQGILLPKAFNFEKDTRQDYRLRTPADAIQFLQKSDHKDIGRFGINSRDGTVRVLPSGQGITIQVPKSKAKGGKYFLDKALLEAMGEEFVSQGSFMRATVDGPAAERALAVVMKKQALYALPSMAEEARAIVGDEPAPPKPVPPPAFSRNGAAGGMAPARVSEVVQAIRSRWSNAPEVVVVENLQDTKVPERVRRVDAEQRSQGASGAPEGFFYGGRVYLLADQLAKPKDVARVLMHESLGHFGLRGVYGDRLGPILDRMAALNAGKVRAAAQRLGLDYDKPAQRRMAAEEVLAYMAQETPTIGWVRRAVSAVRSWLRENVPGFGAMKFSDNDLIREFILPARAWVQRGPDGGPRGGGEPAPAFSREASTDTPAFRKWFGDSKVVNAEGKPLVVYHGTTGDFSVFSNAAQSSATDAGFYGPGFYFANRADVASNYAKQHVSVAREERHSGGNVMPVYLKMDRPFITDEEVIDDATVAKLKNDGYDGVIATFDAKNGYIEYVVFKPEQVKSAIGNRGTFDPEDPNILFSRRSGLGAALTQSLNSVRDVQLPAGYKVADLLGDVPGRLHWWHKTVGTMYNLAQRSEPFRKVYDGVQEFLNDVSFYAAEAADLAPRILPKLEHMRDVWKSPLSAADTKALAGPVFGGTLTWGRDADGVARPIEDITADYADTTGEEKGRILMRAGKVSPEVLRMWQGLPIDQFEQIINGKFEREILKPGVVFTAAELKKHFGLNDEQIGLYREFRRATDRSLDNLAVSEMLRLAGKDGAPIRDAVVETGSPRLAADMLREYLLSLADADAGRSPVLTETANKMLDIAARVEDLQSEGYAPLSRFGTYTLEATLPTGERYFSLFETPRERARMQRTLLADGAADIRTGTMSQEDYKLLDGVSPETIALFGEMLGLDSQGDEAKDKAFQEFIRRGVANRSAMKRMLHRKGIAGFSEDAGRVLAGFIYSNGRRTASNLHTGDITQAVSDIPKEQGELKDAAVKLREYVSNPMEEAQGFRALLFAQYLGGSVASAMVNATQPFAVTLPWLSQFGGARKAAGQIAAAARDATRDTTGDERLDEALKKAEEDGIVSPQEVHALQAQAQGRAQLRSGDGTRSGDAAAAVTNSISRLSLAWGKVFGVAEQFNRRTTYIAAYRTAVEQGMRRPDDFARRAVVETQFTYNKGNKPRWARGAVGSILFTFKQYSVNYVEMLVRMANAGEPGSPERASGQRAALLALGVLFLLGGAEGLPFVEDVQDVVDGALQRMGYNVSTNQKMKEFFAQQLGKGAGDFVMNGVSGIPGIPIDVSGRLGMGNLIPGTGIFHRKDNYSRDLMELAGPGGDFVKRGFQATEAVIAGDVGKAVNTMLPVAGRNITKAADMIDTGMYRDDRSRKVIDTTVGEAIAKGLGFQPRDVAEVQEATYEVQRQKSTYILASSQMREKWARAIFEDDKDLLEEARNDMRSWNEKNPQQRITPNMVAIRRRVAEMRKSKAERVADTAPKAIRAEARRQLQEAL